MTEQNLEQEERVIAINYVDNLESGIVPYSDLNSRSVVFKINLIKYLDLEHKHELLRDILLSDDNWVVRAHMAKHGFDKGVLDSDSDYRVKVAVKDFKTGSTTELAEEDLMTHWSKG